jgi:hypothetical protein
VPRGSTVEHPIRDLQRPGGSCYLPGMHRAALALAVVLAMIAAGYVNGGIGGGYINRLLGFQQPNSGVVEPFRPMPFQGGQSRPPRPHRRPDDGWRVRSAVGTR